MDNPLVTVICLTYNHAGLIYDALEGFVGQRAPFDIEVLVHDDASTDGTTEIVREYEARYPDIIRGVYQTENQYSQGVAIAPAFLFPLVRGRYVALCEGDDYWTDPDKLRKQVEALERHPEVDLCAHRALCQRDRKPHGYLAPRLRDACIPVEDVILGGGHFVATSSLLCRREAYLLQTPMREVLVNDYVLQIQGALRGGMYYLDDCMSVYRQGVSGSWTSQNGRWMPDDVREQLKQMLDVLNDYTNGQYHGTVELRKRMFDANGLLARKRYAALLSPRELPITLKRVSRDLARTFRTIILSCRK